MAQRRNPRVDEAVKEHVAAIIEHDLADPRLELLTVTDVRVSQDSKHATVFYTTVDPGIVARDPRRTGGDDPATADEAQEALAAAASRIRTLLGQRARLRNTPELRFESDPVAASAGRVEDILRDLRERGETT